MPLTEDGCAPSAFPCHWLLLLSCLAREGGAGKELCLVCHAVCWQRAIASLRQPPCQNQRRVHVWLVTALPHHLPPPTSTLRHTLGGDGGRRGPPGGKCSRTVTLKSCSIPLMTLEQPGSLEAPPGVISLPCPLTDPGTVYLSSFRCFVATSRAGMALFMKLFSPWCQGLLPGVA